MKRRSFLLGLGASAAVLVAGLKAPEIKWATQNDLFEAVRKKNELAARQMAEEMGQLYFNGVPIIWDEPMGDGLVMRKTLWPRRTPRP